MCLQALALMAAGTLLQRVTQNAALKRQNEAASAAVRNQMQYQNQANNVVQQQIKDVQPAQRQDRQQQAEQTLDTAFTDAIKRGESQAALSENNAAGGTLSDAYRTARADALANQTQDAIDRARLQASILAPDQARMFEGFGIADTAAKLNEITGNARGQAGADQLTVQAAGQTNPYLTAIGQALSGVGQGKLIGSIYGAAVPKAPAVAPAAAGGINSTGLAAGRGFLNSFSM